MEKGRAVVHYSWSAGWNNQNAAWWYQFIHSTDIYCLTNKYHTFDYRENKDYVFWFIMKKYWLVNEYISYIAFLFKVNFFTFISGI